MARYTDYYTPADEGSLAGEADARADAFAAEMVALGFELCDDGFLRGPELPAHHLGKAYMVRTCYELVDGRWEGFASMRYAD